MNERALHDNAIRILLVDDDPRTARWVSQSLGNRSTIRCELTHVAHFERGRVYVHDIILFTVREHERLDEVSRLAVAVRDRPIVVLSVADDDDFASRAVASGAEECLSIESLDARQLTRAIRHALHRRRRFTALEAIQKRDRYLASHDCLTGLPNRRLFLEYLSRALAYAKRYNEGLAVLFLDLDGFKNVNDEIGHAAGDRLLRGVARRIKRSLRESDIVARFGGDEFAIVVRKVVAPSFVSTVAEKILHELARPFSLRDRRVVITASIGIALYPCDSTRSNGLIDKADEAMYAVKNAGGSGCRFFSQLQSDEG